MVNTFEDLIEIAKSQVEFIPCIKANTSFWMIRAKKGVFYKEFLDNKFIAIGWNTLTSSNIVEDDENLKILLTSKGYPDKMPGTAINKCRRFVDEIKKDDIAVIVGRDEIAFAYVGDYFECDHDTTTIEKELDINAQIDNGSYMGGYCPYKKRRHITIINKVKIDLISPSIYKCLVSNRHSLSNLNDYADAIISASYDIAYYNDRLIVKYHIGQPKDINPYHFSRFTLNTVILLADEEQEITGKYNINSEGDLVLFILNSGKEICAFIAEHLPTLCVIYLILFGGKGLGFEFPSAIDKIKGWVVDILCLKESMRQQKASTDKLEAETEKIKAETDQIRVKTEYDLVTLENLRQQKEKEALQIVNDLQKSADPLTIQPPSVNIVNLINALFNHQSN